MYNFNNVDLLDIIEAYATDNNLIDSEQALSERFDQIIEEMLTEGMPQSQLNDEPFMAETFNNWTDALCKEGEIHQEQYNTYTYVGKYS